MNNHDTKALKQALPALLAHRIDALIDAWWQAQYASIYRGLSVLAAMPVVLSDEQIQQLRALQRDPSNKASEP